MFFFNKNVYKNLRPHIKPLINAGFYPKNQNKHDENKGVRRFMSMRLHHFFYFHLFFFCSLLSSLRRMSQQSVCLLPQLLRRRVDTAGQSERDSPETLFSPSCSVRDATM